MYKIISYKLRYSKCFGKKMCYMEPNQMNIKAHNTMCKIYKRLYKTIREMP